MLFPAVLVVVVAGAVQGGEAPLDSVKADLRRLGESVDTLQDNLSTLRGELFTLYTDISDT